jgi:hypothetical protein
MGTCQSRRLKDDTSIAEKWRYESGLEKVADLGLLADCACKYRDCGVTVRHDDSGGEVGKDLSFISPDCPLCLAMASGSHWDILKEVR